MGLAVIDIVRFLAFLFVVSVVSVIVIRGFFGLYNSLETYHKLPKQYERQTERDGNGYKIVYGEAFSSKLLHVSWYTFVAALAATAVLMIYLPVASGLDINLSVSAALGGVFIIVVMNFTLRIASFMDFKLPDDSDVRDTLRQDLHNFGFSFMCSLYFLWVLGFGLQLANGSAALSFDISESFRTSTGLFAVAATILAPAFSAVVSETILWFRPPPPGYGDDCSKRIEIAEQSGEQDETEPSS